MDFKFDTRVPRDCPDMTLKNFLKRGRGRGHVTPKIFWALNVKCSLAQSGYDTQNFSQNVASLKIYLAEICTLTSAF